MIETRLYLVVVACAISGCAQTQYRASELPRKYAARSVRDYSTVDLTPYARQVANQDAIRPGDRLQVTLDTGTLQENSEHVWKVSIDDSGATSLPNIGPVKLAGLTNTEAERSIVKTSLERDVFLTPTVEVKVAQRRERIILVSGAVEEPGPVKILDDDVSLADVIVQAGGITSEASGTITISSSPDSDTAPAAPLVPNAVLPVGQKTVQATVISLETASKAELAETKLGEGSVVHVEATTPRPIKVVGVIKNQVVEVPSGQNVRLLDAVTQAGGQTYSNWISDRVTITRHVPGSDETIRIKGSIRKARADSAENILLAPYDIITVEENLMTFTLSTLSGLFGAGANAARIGAY
ncbi:polysaccharide biosynthesis/export family protein [Fuerstiella marisgermanici]|uniref:Polysaccharide export protein n=1 Tax=Fuerstiella marisgermanici TaxID=1891926 RepID=A0A1P8WN31_9PLAN|nr:polysaccharide biosynthesis/export family protein [Fuerstiella marisgermanici]APZ95447.1 polysaccharide export protein [Fuerstiella marisgermanici]